MNARLRASGIFILLGVGLATAGEKPMRVDASRDLRLAIVDASKASPARDTQHAAFANSLGEALSQQCGSTVGVRTKVVSADSAAFNLGTGVYDAVLAIGSALPRPLMISEVSRLSAVLGAGKTEKKLYLVFGTGDEGLVTLLSGSFPVALNNPKFLDTLDDPVGRAAPKGEKVASAGP